jgi:hypothetical protein
MAVLLRRSGPSVWHWLLRPYVPWNINKWPDTWHGSSPVKWPPAKNRYSPRRFMSLEKFTEQIFFKLERFRIWICVNHVAEYVLLPLSLIVPIRICFWTPGTHNFLTPLYQLTFIRKSTFVRIGDRCVTAPALWRGTIRCNERPPDEFAKQSKPRDFFVSNLSPVAVITALSLFECQTGNLLPSLFSIPFV